MTTSLEIEIRNLEESLLQPDIRQSTEALNQLLSADFLEYGTSGKVYTKKDILENLPTEQNYAKAGYIPTDFSYEYTSKVSLFDFELRILGDNVVQAIYKTQQENGNIVLRASIWKKHRSYGWQIYFHQGTN